MMRPLLFALLLAAAPLIGGCVDPGNPDTTGNLPAPVADLLAGESLALDPQNIAHPAFGWPTLANPANGTNVPEFWQAIPASPIPNPLAGLQLVARSPDDVRQAAGIALFGSLAVVPGYGANTTVLDISDPANPQVLSSFRPQQEGMGGHRGAAIIAYPDGRLVTVISTGLGIDSWNITDPRHPEPLEPIIVRSHKVGVVPGTPIVYNAKSSGGGQTTGRMADTGTGVTEIFDFTDPEEPVKVQDWKNGFSCHHVYFWNDPAQEKYRGICAGIEFTQIWDTTDPRNPKVIVSVPVHHGVAGTPSGSLPSAQAFSHYAGLSKHGNILLVGDENGGGAMAPGCVASANTPAGAVSTPIGALWFYDVSVETNPKLLGWYSPLNDPRIKPAPDTSCTAHHGRIVPVEGRDVIAMSFYGAGVVLVDFTGIGTAGGPLPKVIDQFADKSDTWETWYYQGYLFTGDLARGLDVLKFE